MRVVQKSFMRKITDDCYRLFCLLYAT